MQKAELFKFFSVYVACHEKKVFVVCGEVFSMSLPKDFIKWTQGFSQKKFYTEVLYNDE